MQAEAQRLLAAERERAAELEQRLAAAPVANGLHDEDKVCLLRRLKRTA